MFVSGDSRAARQRLQEKEKFRDLERGVSENRFKRPSAGKFETIETSAIHLDVIRDLKRIHSHIVSVAYSILDATGSLRRSRLEDDEGPNAESSGNSGSADPPADWA